MVRAIDSHKGEKTLDEYGLDCATIPVDKNALDATCRPCLICHISENAQSQRRFERRTQAGVRMGSSRGIFARMQVLVMWRMIIPEVMEVMEEKSNQPWDFFVSRQLLNGAFHSSSHQSSLYCRERYFERIASSKGQAGGVSLTMEAVQVESLLTFSPVASNLQ